ncbi:MAG: class I SAM-dependent methyltransferase [Deltaproteobacteria bacterium]|nr:class I SAM-dependent methyltransferase [Deltaproteobacteria bacterium]
MITVDFERTRIRPGSRVLDVGCGSGRHVGAAYQQPATTAIGTDLCFHDLTQARERLRLHDRLGEHGGGAWGLNVADITAMPFARHTFDLVICSEVMEHIHDEKTAAKELCRVLRPGCPLVVSVPRFFPEWVCWKLSAEYHLANQGHIRIYRKKKIVALFESCGLRLTSSHYAHSLHTPYWWLKCLVGPIREDSGSVNLYHRFLTWDIMQKPRVTRLLDRLCNPLFGKSLVLYFTKYLY